MTTAQSKAWSLEIVARALAGSPDLGDGTFKWTNENVPLRSMAALENAAGQRLILSIYQNRLIVRGEYPRTLKDGTGTSVYVSDLDEPKITMAVGREPAKVLADIKRRLMPDYEAGWVKYAERREGARNFAERNLDSRAAIVESGLVIARDLQRKAADDQVEFYVPSRDHEWSADGRVHGSSVKLELHSLTAAQAIAVLRLLKGD